MSIEVNRKIGNSIPEQFTGPLRTDEQSLQDESIMTSTQGASTTKLDERTKLKLLLGISVHDLGGNVNEESPKNDSSWDEIFQAQEKENSKKQLKYNKQKLIDNATKAKEHAEIKQNMCSVGNERCKDVYDAFYGKEDDDIKKENLELAQKISKILKTYPDFLTDDEKKELEEIFDNCNLNFETDKTSVNSNKISVSEKSSSSENNETDSSDDPDIIKEEQQAEPKTEKDQIAQTNEIRTEESPVGNKTEDKVENIKDAQKADTVITDKVQNANEAETAKSSNKITKPVILGVSNDIINAYEKNHSNEYPYEYTYNKDGMQITVSSCSGSYYIEVNNGDEKYSHTLEKDKVIYLENNTNGNTRISSEKLPNGKIDEKFTQGNVGDCWLLSTINALASKENGLKILNDSVHVNDDNSVTVDLKGKNKQYTIPLEELVSEKGSSGDLDVKAIEIAVKKYLEEEDKMVLGKFEGNVASTATDILVGKTKSVWKLMSECVSNWMFGFSDNDIREFNAQDKIFVGATTKYSGGTHGVSILGSDDKYVYVQNPWFEGKEKLTWDEFRKTFFNVEEIKYI